MRRFSCVGAFAAAAMLLVGAASASATTYCVPDFTAACPNSGGNVKQTDLETAMSANATDGQADTIDVAPGTFTENATFEPGAGSGANTFEATGSDPLTIVGAGPSQTVVTSAGTTNIYVVNLSYNNSRAVTVRDLTLRIPASFPDSNGNGEGILLAKDDVLDNVDIVSRNPDSHGLSSGGVGNVFRNGELRGEAGGSIGNGLKADSIDSELLVEDAVLKGASWGLVAEAKGAKLTARRVREVGTRTYGALASPGSMTIENSVMTIDDGIGLYVGPDANDASLNADHVTIVNSGGSDPVIQGKKFGVTAGSATATVTNSILRGFASGYDISSQFGPGIGVIKLIARYSDIPQNGTNAQGTADFATGNIDVDPLFNADYSLQAGSPSIDAGDPGAGLTSDLLGAARPVDGNGDGTARRDQGAFEYQPPPPPGGGGGGDTTPPNTRIRKGPGKKLGEGTAKFKFRSTEANSTFRCKLDRGKVRRCKSPKAYKHLKPGPHIFRVWAVDAAGNKDPMPAKRRFRVPA